VHTINVHNYKLSKKSQSFLAHFTCHSLIAYLEINVIASILFFKCQQITYPCKILKQRIEDYTNTSLNAKYVMKGRIIIHAYHTDIRSELIVRVKIYACCINIGISLCEEQ